MIEQTLGRGPSGTVYRVIHTETQAEYSIKVLSPQVAGDPQVLAAMRMAVARTATLNHPNLARIDQLVDSCSTPYLLMEYTDGEDLKPIASGGGAGCRARSSCRWPSKFLRGSNISTSKACSMRTSSRRTCFGPGPGRSSSRTTGMPPPEAGGQRSDVGGLTSDLCPLTSDLRFPPFYRAPEQFVAGAETDQRADVYAVGMLFCRLLGGFPFGGALGTPDPQAIEAWHRDVRHEVSVGDPELDRFVARALAVYPAARYANCKDLLQDLRRAFQEKEEVLLAEEVEEEPVEAVLVQDAAPAAQTLLPPLIPLPAPSRRPSGRQSMPTWAVVAIVLGGIGVAVILLVVVVASALFLRSPSHPSIAPKPYYQPIPSAPNSGVAVVGTWSGTMSDESGQTGPGSLEIKRNGTYELTVYTGTGSGPWKESGMWHVDGYYLYTTPYGGVSRIEHFHATPYTLSIDKPQGTISLTRVSN